MRFILELIRIFFIFLLLGSLFYGLLLLVYSPFGVNMDSYGTPATIAIFIMLYILYRNKLQFRGWYVGKGREKLPKRVTRILVIISCVLMIVPILMTFWLD